jgi:hypothetical protein
MLTPIFILLVAFQIKHFMCDFPLQGRYMLGKFKERGWIAPLAAHCGVHAVGTLVVLTLWSNTANAALLAAAVFDFVMHFAMDRLKASPKMWGRYKPDQPSFWYALGLDQMWHHLTHYVIIAWALYVTQ